jgi:hypothetical protein
MVGLDEERVVDHVVAEYGVYIGYFVVAPGFAELDVKYFSCWSVSGKLEWYIHVSFDSALGPKSFDLLTCCVSSYSYRSRAYSCFLVDSSDTKRFWVRRWKNVRVRHNEISSQSIFPYVFCDIFIGESCAYIWLDDFRAGHAQFGGGVYFLVQQMDFVMRGFIEFWLRQNLISFVFVRLCAWRTGWIDGLRPPRNIQRFCGEDTLTNFILYCLSADRSIYYIVCIVSNCLYTLFCF